MKIHFHKFQGNGNDFVILDNRSNKLLLSKLQIQRICNRKFGIGADGLMLVNISQKYDFEMVYYNSDGNISSMCGNGGRCIAAFTNLIGLSDNEMVFEAYDGPHKAIIEKEIVAGKEWDVSLQLTDVNEVEENEGYYFLDTGSPHYVEFVDKAAEIDVAHEGRKTRQSERFAPDGTNVNFVELSKERLFVRTYERGVEEETLSCGTGVAAAAIAAFLETGKEVVSIHTAGGDFKVSFTQSKGDNSKRFTNIWLRGPAEFVFEGDAVIAE
ncbi:MAG: diaminopimelate epimerase [Bacteroidetes bacterium]|nr:diaminopimelate epimerase [Bacteroidota bacterium]MBL6944212.1 diaminopimelate epimerase [Bacteroidales bacterium]